uniref:Uncharacterized protein n=1 Tax=Rhizophora mucronata TaxID=61149 RepID=A0A2P2QAH6_RHIMU
MRAQSTQISQISRIFLFILIDKLDIKIAVRPNLETEVNNGNLALISFSNHEKKTVYFLTAHLHTNQLVNF